MSDQSRTYLEEELQAVLSKEGETVKLVFQKERIKLEDADEIRMIQNVNPAIMKKIQETEDELTIIYHISPAFASFAQVQRKEEKSRWIFASQLIKGVNHHSLSRLHLLVCPENLVVDESLTPYFLHYGVMESLPPYEKDDEKLWQETKAVIATAIDRKYTFKEYLKLSQTLELSSIAKSIMNAKDEDELLDIIRKGIKRLEDREKQVIQLPKRKWKITRYATFGLSALLIPALILVVYSFLFAQPKQAAYVQSSEHFLKNEYSQVVTTLNSYEAKDMPRVVQYKLATSYIINESLNEDQKDTLQNRITLQSDRNYYLYWIHIGRGEAEQALDIARSLEDSEIILYALLKYKEQIRAQQDLSGEEKQNQLKEIQDEIDEYAEAIKTLEEEEETEVSDEE
ncbi:type VII secretion protein EssB [Sutcliffiella horikoshii]|uniref:type VII secretion protein EssB n=1 Tax=Sutcliffiella horikoshii TaxID=79883 RepID=UPI002040F380|nr:type VII secretion protein EssB [Sutcliffiella horikoshii]MCM3616555.1 type VII secretion protein EssB [Sutcliffiella horikoshii]